jgi:hypothetical protein
MQRFDGIAEKLTRVKENIFNLESEISGFFQEGDYPVLPENDRKLLLEAIEYHKNRIIPPRFSVLAGEVVHHLRSCFDHIVWHYSTGPKQNEMPVDFPVFEAKPVKSYDRKRFEGKIQRVIDINVRLMIERLQPYNATDPIDDPLCIIHRFDIMDKHKELVFCIPTGARVFPPEMQSVVEGYQRQHPELDPAQIAYHFKGHGPLVPYISFKDFGRRKIQPVIPGLTDLFNYTVNAVNEFASL